MAFFVTYHNALTLSSRLSAKTLTKKLADHHKGDKDENFGQEDKW